MLALLEATSLEEKMEGEEDNSEDECIMQSDHDSDSEMEASESDNEMTSDSKNNYTVHEDFFLGKDKSTKWQKKPVVSKFAKTSSKNLIKILPRPYKCSIYIRNELEAFQKYITSEMIDSIVINTNKFIVSIQINYVRERDAKPVTNLEVLAFFGLLFLSGLKQSNHTNFHELWAQDGTGYDLFPACMSYNRFLFILSVI